MNTQPEALRLADLWDGKAKSLQTWVDENDYVEFGYKPEGLKKEQADQFDTATELRRLHAANINCVDHFNVLMDERNELLEALKDIVEFWDSIVPTDAVNQMHINARTAIARATGEQA